MSEIYNEQYYHSGCGPIPYEDPEHWVKFFGMIADHIISDLGPTTVLDAGCAMGYLVAALRDRGVEAYGIDISEYAISMARDDIKQYCVVGSLTENLPNELPQHYDLVVTIEVMEHLYAEDGKKAIANLCKLSDTVLFSSTPDDFEERTHVNVQQREYWARLFFEEGFVDDINYRPRYLTDYASLFRRSDNICRLIEDYERNIRMSEHKHKRTIAEWQGAVNDKTADIQNIEVRLAEKEKSFQEALIQYDTATKKWDSEKTELHATIDKITNLLQSERKNASEQLHSEQEKHQQYVNQSQEELTQVQEHYHAAIAQREDLKRQLAEVQAAYNVISNAFFWKITKPLRVIVDLIKRPLRKIRFFRLINKGVRCWKANGFRYTWEKVKNKFEREQEVPVGLQTRSVDIEVPTEMPVEETIKFSVIVPLYNTPKIFLKEMIESVIHQNYSNWELCLIDASSEGNDYVREICEAYAQQESRILYQKLGKNLGISKNTNQGIALATGEYIGFLDHDDLLMPNALLENCKAIYATDADVLYSDEDHLSKQGQHVFPFYKPDWSPDLLYSQMYVCHFMVVKKELIDGIGGFRSEFDGSQDYDLLLRIAEITDRICHIPEILYTWRESESSTAANPDSKPYADNAGKRALEEHIKKRFCDCAYVENTEYTFVYNPRFTLPDKMIVSIIIPMKDKWEMSDQCVQSILDKSTYQDYEIILLNNRSEKQETYQWFEHIKEVDNRIHVFDADMEFNWSKLNNYGVSLASGDVFIFLNNDTLIISEDWIERLSENALRKDIGLVGALLLYPDDTIQHAGVVVGMGGWADHVFKGMSPIHFGSPYVSPMVSRNVLAVTGACMAIAKSTWEKIGPFDEEFVICGSDVELGIRAYEKGFYNRYDANVRLYHLESKSRDSYIPEIDFKKSDEMYDVYRKNGDPFYNVNLSKNSVTPKEIDTPMPRINLRNYLKRYPLVVKAYHQIKKRLMPPAEYRIPETEPICPRKTTKFVEKRLNLLVPSVDQKHVFGGIATALKLFYNFCEQMNCAGRIITMDAMVDMRTAAISDEYHLIKSEDDGQEHFQVMAFADRANKTIPVSENDYFVATAWWTAYLIRDVIMWQAQEYNTPVKPLIYIIQDYEPGFYPWSSRYLMAESTYHLDIPVYAVINSSELKDFLSQKNYSFDKVWCFDPVLNEGLKRYLPENTERIPKKKQIIIYGRPSVDRNAFGILVAGLKKWSEQQECAYEWSVYSLGEEHDDVELSSGHVMHSMGKLPLDAYAKFLLESYAGVSLMVSPHPSYPPLEMATFGIKTITNSYANKNLEKFSKNITSLEPCTPQTIADALQEICGEYSGFGDIQVNPVYVEPNQSFSSIATEINRSLNNVP